MLAGVVIAAFALVAWVGGARADNVGFKNDLAGCVAIKVREISMEGNVVAAHTVVTLAKSIGECRCLSALATYTSSVGRGGVREVLQTGLVSLMNGGEKVSCWPLTQRRVLAEYYGDDVRRYREGSQSRRRLTRR
jgi:hypothetical protein